MTRRHTPRASRPGEDPWVPPGAGGAPSAEEEGSSGPGDLVFQDGAGRSDPPGFVVAPPIPVRSDRVVLTGGVVGTGWFTATWPFGRFVFDGDSVEVTSILPRWLALGLLPPARMERAPGAGIMSEANRFGVGYRLQLADGSLSKMSFAPLNIAKCERTAREFGWAISNR